MSTSFLHEGFVRLFHDRPALVAELLRDVLGVELPRYTEARIESADLTDIEPAKRYADLVVLLVDDKPVHGIVLEAQLDIDIDKLWSWPVYVANLRARIRYSVDLLVVTASAQVARWAAREIVLGDGGRLRPLVIGPDGVPVITDPEIARRDPALAVLSAMARGPSAEGAAAVDLATAALRGLEVLDRQHAVLYADLILTACGDAARVALEKLMATPDYELKSAWMLEQHAKGRAEGRAQGRAEEAVRALLTVLEGRSLAVSSDERLRIEACSDLAQLEAWLRRAGTVASTNELFSA